MEKSHVCLLRKNYQKPTQYRNCWLQSIIQKNRKTKAKTKTKNKDEVEERGKEKEDLTVLKDKDMIAVIDDKD